MQRINDIAGPELARFAGNSTGRVLKRWFHATRPKFLPASLLPVLVGTTWGVTFSGQFDVMVFLLALSATLFVHAGANVLNDVADDAGGTDRQNVDRIYPYTGGSQFIQSGIVSAASMARLAITLLGIAAVAGLVLMLIKGIMIFYFGAAGIAIAVLYSLGPLRLNAIGLGEIAVGIAFGVLPVTGAAWLQSGVINSDLLLFSLPVSAWVAAILLINEVPDIVADGATGKRTLPVRLGHRRTAALYAAIQIFAAAVIVWLWSNGTLPVAAILLTVVLLAIAFKASRTVQSGLSNRSGMTNAIEATLAIHTIGSLSLIGLVLFSTFRGS